jgi:hypothetical protein
MRQNSLDRGSRVELDRKAARVRQSFDRNPFGELLLLMSIKDLAFWRKRSRETGNYWLAEILDDEICERRIGRECFGTKELRKASQ